MKKLAIIACCTLFAVEGVNAQDTTDILAQLENEMKKEEKAVTNYATATFKTTMAH